MNSQVVWVIEWRTADMPRYHWRVFCVADSEQSAKAYIAKFPQLTLTKWFKLGFNGYQQARAIMNTGDLKPTESIHLH